MPEQTSRPENLYVAVLQSMKKEGFCCITTADIADVHSKLKQGFGAQDQAGQVIAQHLLAYLRATNLSG